MKENFKWPELLSDCLELALKDFKSCIEDPHYTIDLAVWHLPSADGVCLVCLGGAVIAQTFGQSRTFESVPSDLDSRTDIILGALDLLRLGRIDEAIRRFKGIATPPGVKDTVLPVRNNLDEEDTLDEFQEDMGNIVIVLRDASN